MEYWKPIIGFEGLYEISSDGRVRSVSAWVKHRYGRRLRRKRIRKLGENSCGYIVVLLSKNNKMYCKRVSRLVAIHFIPNPLNLPEVNHRFGNKKDNRAVNLNWSSVGDNRKHAWDMGLNYGNTKNRNLRLLASSPKIG